MRLRVAVCTNRGAPAVTACLTALADQPLTDAPLLVLSAPSQSDHQAHRGQVAAVLPRAEVVVEPRAGLSVARNRALSLCGDDDVLAFLDDDAIPGPGWAAALTGAWVAAERAVACVGGPIRPRFLAPRPRWLADELLPNLTVLDYGPLPVEVDPRTHPLYGANVSFRCGPLRRVGGFDPALGHRGRRERFGEEDAAERALADAGYRARYEPGAWVEHLIAPERLRRSAVLRRRFHYGRRLGRDGARDPGLALRQAARSSAGVLAAAGGRRPDAAMARGARVAENAGVLAGLLAGRTQRQ